MSPAFYQPIMNSVADPDPSDPYVFGLPGSRSFYFKAKIARKPLIPSVLFFTSF
jgi:hypothetical protein